MASSPRRRVVCSFETFFEAGLTLFQIICGEVWLNLMDECSVTLPKCTEAYGDVLSDCGHPMLGPVFFFSFFILTFAVFLNLYGCHVVCERVSGQWLTWAVAAMCVVCHHNQVRRCHFGHLLLQSG